MPSYDLDIQAGRERPRRGRLLIAAAAACAVGLAACGGSGSRPSVVVQTVAGTAPATTDAAQTEPAPSTTTRTRVTRPRPADPATPTTTRVTSTSPTTTVAAPTQATTTTPTTTHRSTTHRSTPPAHPRSPADPLPPAPARTGTDKVVACLTRAGVARARSAGSGAWVAYDAGTGQLLYVEGPYPTAAVGAYVRALAISKQVKRAGGYVVFEARGSARIGAVAACLGTGSGTGSGGRGRLTF